MAASKVDGFKPGQGAEGGVGATKRVPVRVLEAEVCRLDIPVKDACLVAGGNHLEDLKSYQRQTPLTQRPGSLEGANKGANRERKVSGT